jgi:type I restriction enzyme S subunit
LIQDLLTGNKRLDGFNEKWKDGILGDIFSIKKGAGLSKEKLDDSGKFECILYGELYTTYNEVIYSIKSRTSADEGTPSKSGDILIPASTTTGAIDLAVATCLDKDGVRLGGDINILRPREKLDSRFFAYYLTHTKKHTLARLAQGVTIVHLYASDFKDIKVEIPKLEEQKKIANIITTAEKEIVILSNKLKTLKEQKRYLLNNLITGTIRTPETLSAKLTK